MWSSLTQKLKNSWAKIQLWKERNKTALYWARQVLTVLFFIIVLVFIIKWITRPMNNPEPPKIGLQPVTTYKDSKGDKYANAEAQEVSEEQMKSIIDSLNLEFQKKGTTTTLTEAVVKTDTVFIKVPVQVDSNEFLIVRRDDYIDLTVKGNTKTKEADITFKYFDTIVTAQRTIKRLFKPDVTVVEIRNKNPYSSITHVQSFSLKEKKPIISVGAGVVYNPIVNKVQYGLGVYIPVFSIKTK